MWVQHFTSDSKTKKHKRFYRVTPEQLNVQLVTPVQQRLEQAKSQIKPEKTMMRKVQKKKPIKPLNTIVKAQYKYKGGRRK